MPRAKGPFRRQPASRPTRHLSLRLASADPAAHQEALAQLLARWNATLTFCEPGKRHCYVSLPSPAAAAEVMAALDGTTPAPLADCGPLAFAYAVRRDEADAAAAADPPLVACRSAEECGIPGLAFWPDWVSPAEEAELLEVAATAQHWQLLARRRVLHFGHEFDYATRGVGTPQHELPAAARAVAARLQALPGGEAADQLTVNEYESGVGIAPHVETHSAFTGAIASLSLGGPAVMAFRREGRPPAALFLPPRSLVLLTGEARYCWQHYIPQRKTDLVAPAAGSGGSSGGSGGEPEAVPRAPRRVSFTFRQVRRTPCDCAYPEFCDSQLAPLAPTRLALQRLELEAQQQQQQGSEQRIEQQQQQQQQREEQPPPGAASHPAAATGDDGSASADAGPAASTAASTAAECQLAALEARYVHAVYDAIAPHFASTRFAVWPRVRAFLQALPRGALLADVGCGNGKYFAVAPCAYVLGSDRSQGLARVAARRLAPRPLGEALHADVAVADGLALPYRPGCCDGVLCIAVLHHISSPARRLALLAQLLRVLRPGGRALVTVWATQQENMRKVRSWRPIDAAEAAAGLREPGAEVADAEAGSAQPAAAVAAADSRAAAASAGGQQAEEVPSGDYFVPWHLPFHRAEAAAAVRQVAAGSGASAGSSGGGGGSHPPAAAAGAVGGEARAASGAPGQAAPAPGQAEPAASAPRLDASKGAVVFQRYYHLFAAGELEALVAQLPGARLVESFYDRDNWCAVFERA